jgi:hypothetical protein
MVMVELLALRAIRPRRAGGQWATRLEEVLRPFVAPLNAALLVAARQVPPAPRLERQQGQELPFTPPSER